MSEKKVSQVAQEIGRDRRTIKKWIKNGLVKGREPVSVGDAWYVDELSLKEFISNSSRCQGMTAQRPDKMSYHNDDNVMHTHQDILLPIIAGLRQELESVRNDNQRLRESCAALIDDYRQLALSTTLQLTAANSAALKKQPTQMDTPISSPAADKIVDTPIAAKSLQHQEFTSTQPESPDSRETNGSAAVANTTAPQEKVVLPVDRQEEWLQIGLASSRLAIPKSTLRDRAKRGEIVARNNGCWEILLVDGQLVKMSERSS